jgi:hypothetical protein
MKGIAPEGSRQMMTIVKVKDLRTEPDKTLVICPKCGSRGQLVLLKPTRNANIHHKLGLDDGNVLLPNGEIMQALAPTWQPLEFCSLREGEWEHLVPAEKKRPPAKVANASLQSIWGEACGAKADPVDSPKKARKARSRASATKPRHR